MRVARRIFAGMQTNRKVPRSSQRTAAKPKTLELPPDRAFVLHLHVRAQLPRRLVGRVEHVTPGKVACVTLLQELMALPSRAAASIREGEWAAKSRPLADAGRREKQMIAQEGP